MEQVQRVLVEVTAAASDAVIGDVEAHRDVARRQPGFRGMSIARSETPGGNTLLSVETRWRDNNSLADYASQQPNVESVIRGHSAEIVANSLEVRRLEAVGEEEAEPSGPVYERMAFALFVPIGVLVFALLVIYGLSRIYLALNPHVATPLAAIVAIGILGVCGYIAAHPMIQRWQVATIVGAVAALLLGGGIYAGVNGKHPVEVPPSVQAAARATAPAAGGPTAVPGALLITTPSDTKFDKSELTAKAGTQVTVTYDNKSDIIHDIRFFNGPDAKSPSLAATKLGKNDSQTITFTAPSTPGKYFFHCDAHPTLMTGFLIVN